FTEDMLENVVKETTATVTHSRDRIYFYLDENASTQARTARVEVKYKSANEERTDYIELVQAGLIPFTYNGTTYYMEAYEEYTMHYDPLDPHGTTGWYDPEGIPWAAEGTPQNNKAFSDGVLNNPFGGDVIWSPIDVIHGSDGQTICKYIMGIQTYSDYNVDQILINKIFPEKSVTAIGSACSKNKKTSSLSNQQLHWFLPSIEQLGTMMTSANVDKSNFEEYFYWSVNTARNPNRTVSGLRVRGRENPFRARATKLNSNGSLVLSEVTNTVWGYPSSTSDDAVTSDYTSGDYNSISYPNGGRTLRTQKLRVRAIRVADGVSTN
ncbi:MAG: hypothetical protein K2M11_03020, partial [Paramuribaculum sp.]|nr:hypothetical protein [Paramuribaculum sp.]